MENQVKKSLSGSLLTLLISFFISLNTIDAQDIVEVISNSQQHTTFAEIIVEAGLEETLLQPGPYTVVAPTDAAFELLGPDFETIRKNNKQLQNLVINHLFQGEVTSEQVASVLGIEITGGEMTASNGIIYSANQVVLE